MKRVENGDLIENLSWRYAVKKFDATRTIPAETWNTLEQSMVLSPSSFGLQPWKFYVVTDPTIRGTLRAAAYNQSQVTDASHLVVFCLKKGIDAGYVDHYLAAIAQQRGVALESLQGFRQAILGTIAAKGDTVSIWNGRQTYIALGVLLTSAAMLGIDACPMEGFDSSQFDEILGIAQTGYQSAAICALGYRASDDSYQSAAKVRFPSDEVIVRR